VSREAWQQRVVDEQAELDEKILLLGNFFGTPTFAGLSPLERARMCNQYEVMQRYSEILGDRINAF
jgi:hypothetical protein